MVEVVTFSILPEFIELRFELDGESVDIREVDRGNVLHEDVMRSSVVLEFEILANSRLVICFTKVSDGDVALKEHQGEIETVLDEIVHLHLTLFGVVLHCPLHQAQHFENHSCLQCLVLKEQAKSTS
jgi:hypothetical protein